jgi:S-adenosylmethionine:tRNA ribosyltransferase-isomerase
MRTADFNYALPEHLIAQRPAAQRDQSRLLVLDRATGQIAHRRTFRDLLGWLRPGDLLVLNNTRVIPARLRGRKQGSGGDIEVLLVEENSWNDWWALLRPGKRVRAGTNLVFGLAPLGATVSATVLEKNPEGHCRLRFSGLEDIRGRLEELGEIPLPPYITRRPEGEDRERYQTVFAQREGSVAAPTAGLHFTTELLQTIRELGVTIQYVTLHVGLGTFAPVKASTTEDHMMHEEQFSLTAATAESINAARSAGRRIVAVGTTTVRVLESVAREQGGRLVAREGRTRIFIYPPFRFQAVDGLLTNFHLPQSTLLMLVSAFAAPGEMRGRELILKAYAEAVREEYRFFSYGDAMLIV